MCSRSTSSTCERASGWRCWARTAPARRPCSGSWPGSMRQRPAGSRSTACRSPAPTSRLRRRIGYATQRPGLLSTSVIRNVELPLRWRGLDARARRAAALDALERLNVAHLADRKALSLSGGEAQRVSLARALAIEPQLLLLDEPAAGLDAEARRAFFDDLEAALADRATTVVHVSHRAEEALRLADRVAVLTRRHDPPARRPGVGRAAARGRHRRAPGRLRERPAGRRSTRLGRC